MKKIALALIILTLAASCRVSQSNWKCGTGAKREIRPHRGSNMCPSEKRM